MHELSLVASLIDRAQTAALAEGARRVTRLTVRLGALSHLSADHLRDHVAAAAPGTVLDGARVDVTIDTDPESPTAQDIELVSIEVI